MINQTQYEVLYWGAFSRKWHNKSFETAEEYTARRYFLDLSSHGVPVFLYYEGNPITSANITNSIAA